MKTPFYLLFLTLLSFPLLAEARQIGYRDGDGSWHIIDDAKWPQLDKSAALSIEGAVTIMRPTANSTFEITYLDVVNDTRVGFDDPYLGLTRRLTFEAVLTYIDGVIKDSGSCQIEVQASETDGSGFLASGGPFFFTDGPYEESLAQMHLTTGVDPAQSVPDAQLTVDFGWNWNNTTDAPGTGKYDLFSVLLHEVTHGLGLISLTGSDGSSQLDDRVFSTFDNFLYTGTGVKIWNASGVLSVSASALTGNAGGVYFRGPTATEIFGGYPPIYAPSVWSPGSSIGHWDDGLSPDPVMSYAIASGTQNRAYQPFEVKALQDIGYTVEAIGPEADLYDDTLPIANHGGPVNFGSVLLGSAALSRTFILTNNGDQALTTSNLTLPVGFVLSNGLASSIGPGESDSFTIELPATTLGVTSGTVSFTTNDANENPYDFTISGTVTAPSALVLFGDTPLASDSSAVDFGLVVTNSTSPGQTFIVRNDGSYQLTTSNLTVPTGYSVTEPLSSSIAAGGSDSFTVQLVTTQTGLFSGTVSFNTNDTEHNPCSFSVTGEVAEPVAVVMVGTLVLSSNGAPVEFGKAELGASGPTRTFTVSNSGSFMLETSGLSVPEGYSVIEPLSATIAPGASATVTVQLDTAAVGTFAGEVSFATNEPSHDPVTFNVTGLVVEYLSADPGWLDPSL